jgi:hypothetical protein
LVIDEKKLIDGCGAGSIVTALAVSSCRNGVVDQRPSELGNPNKASGDIEILTVNISI